MNEQATMRVSRAALPDELVAMSGLDFIRAIMNGALPPPTMATLVGFDIVEADEGRVVFSGAPTDRHLNPMGVVHGGYAATLLDSCMTCAIQSTLKPGFAATTLDISVRFTRAATAQSGALRAEGKTIHVGKQFGTAEGRLTDPQGRVIAHATTSCLIFPVKPPA